MTQFATTDDVATRLGRTLSDAEQSQADLLLTIATSMIAEAVGRDDAWAADQDPVPTLYRGVCVEAVVRSISNPENVRSRSETLGQFSHSESFTDTATGAGVYLTDSEARIVRRHTYGANTASSHVGSILPESYDIP